MSIGIRIVLIYALLTTVSFSFLVYMILNEVRPRYLEAVEESTVDMAELVAAMLAQGAEQPALTLDDVDKAMSSLRQRSFSAKIYDHEKQRVNLHIYITDNKGILLYDSTARHAPGSDFSRWNDVYLALRGRYGARSTRMDPEDPTSTTIYVAAPIMRENALYGVVTVGKPKNSVSLFIDIAKRKFRFILALTAVICVGLAALLSMWITRPIKKLTAYMRSIKQGPPETPPDLGPAEIREMGAALAEMRASLEGKNYIEDYVRALTHEMKSPLTGIKGAGEILRDHVPPGPGVKFLDNIDSEVQRLQSLVERMLQMSRLENVRAITKKPVKARALFGELGQTLHCPLKGKKITLHTNVPENAVIEGDELLLRQAFGNLLSNAADFSPPESTITVSATEKDGHVAFSIRDQGSGIPDFAKDKVFDKFFSLARPGTGKKSTGLGLPFVKEVANLHGGRIILRDAGPGLEAIITLPSSAE